MRSLLSILLFLPTVCFSQSPKSQADPYKMVDRKWSGDKKACQYPAFVTEILKGHFQKLGDYYSYGDRLADSLKQAKPYSEYFLMKPFWVGIIARQSGDTTTLTVLGYKEDPDFSLANAFDITDHYWNFEDWYVPVYNTREDRTFRIAPFAGERELFKISFTGHGYAGEKSFLLKNECSVCEQ